MNQGGPNRKPDFRRFPTPPGPPPFRFDGTGVGGLGGSDTTEPEEMGQEP